MAKAPRKTKPKSDTAVTLTKEVVHSIKGFNKDWTCRGYQFALGQTYEHEGKVKACEGGFHAIEGHPLEVFEYYPPSGSRYAVVKQSGALSRHSLDSKLASAKITIGVELRLHEIVQRAVKWGVDRCTKNEGEQATGHRGAASSTGDYSAASSTGNYGAASSTGYYGAASSTGHQGAASSTGDCGAAMAIGIEGRVRGAVGNALFLVYRNPDNGDIHHVWAGIAGSNGIKPDVWYRLDKDGNPIECEAA